jgi:hypothetical protein
MRLWHQGGLSRSASVLAQGDSRAGQVVRLNPGSGRAATPILGMPACHADWQAISVAGRSACGQLSGKWTPRRGLGRRVAGMAIGDEGQKLAGAETTDDRTQPPLAWRPPLLDLMPAAKNNGGLHVHSSLIAAGPQGAGSILTRCRTNPLRTRRSRCIPCTGTGLWNTGLGSTGLGSSTLGSRALGGAGSLRCVIRNVRNLDTGLLAARRSRTRRVRSRRVRSRRVTTWRLSAWPVSLGV